MEDKIKIIHMVTEPMRYRLIMLLCERHYCVRVLAMRLGISESAVSQHLKLLKEQNIVSCQRIGYQTHYVVNRPFLQETLGEFLDELAGGQLGELTDECTCEFMPECIRKEGTRKKKRMEN